MNYDLLQETKDLNVELLILGIISKEKYFENEDKIRHFNHLFIINLN